MKKTEAELQREWDAQMAANAAEDKAILKLVKKLIGTNTKFEAHGTLKEGGASWYKRGGYKNATYNKVLDVVNNKKEWTFVQHELTGTPDGSMMGGREYYQHIATGAKVSVIHGYGVVAYDNYFSINIKFPKAVD